MGMSLPSIDQRPARRLLVPFARFAELESSGSMVLLLATVTALALANSRFAGAYERFLELPFGASFGTEAFHWTLQEWVNDGLMAIFFLVVGLEVKRELLLGELASFRRALLPVMGALGGVVTPAIFYWFRNGGGPGARGWGIPIATDIAFSLAILTLFSKRVPVGLKIFLVTLAIVDDIAGVLVIAVAYSSHLRLGFLALVVMIFGVCLLLNRIGVLRLSVYMTAGVVLWWATHASGVHATLAGIVLALAIPSRTFIGTGSFLERGRARLTELAKAVRHSGPLNPAAREHLHKLRSGIELVESPLDRLQAGLHPWVSFGIVPLFALTNAGISLHGFRLGSVRQPVISGILLGLVLGKPIGITVFSWMAVRLRLAELPHGVSWLQLHAVSWLGGIGFTVSIFIAGLALGAGKEYTTARIAVLGGSACAAAMGAAMIALTHRRSPLGIVREVG